jgi:hypothetical protein
VEDNKSGKHDKNMLEKCEWTYDDNGNQIVTRYEYGVCRRCDKQIYTIIEKNTYTACGTIIRSENIYSDFTIITEYDYDAGTYSCVTKYNDIEEYNVCVYLIEGNILINEYWIDADGNVIDNGI